MNNKTRSDNLPPSILIAVGSTGGHYFPAVALAEKILEINPGMSISFAGEKKIENLEIWSKKGFRFMAIPVLKRPRRRFLMPALCFVAVFVLLKSMLLVSGKKIDLIVCMGSYATVFIGIVGLLTRKNIILHEQNFVPGLANRILNRLGVPAAIGFPGTEKFLRKTIVTGIPIRKEFLSTTKNFEKYGLSSGKFTILVLGGSQGAHFINQIVCDCISLLDPEKYQIIHITGKNDYKEVKSFYEGKTINRYLCDFTYEIPDLMNLADIAIARAGAGTIAELSFKGIPSIFIPYPFADGHQRFNAIQVEKNGCIVINQDQANPQIIIDSIKKIQSGIEERKKLFRSSGVYDVNGKFAQLCLDLIKKNG
ncbi:MAG TPA: UDP-N-acetylglucosamine--N-acetylmuramyl-(pentapeptide) pyrophosphoryl-undecaprenol N-acetylglucosamine transferase [Candidatus Ratteibacteria bacterium]|nr:UDP-N-acetylglucosamine--N-acetylmuramyl-(pentapeptide) pyrophosphoryl-undecaprenol N-acetylglucosamine transferase [bacterium]HRS06316.1 UDP-N-acetylglucosamine--N-acetylmuramyl-(pentapeptide) pyrophosphoryl-undecaprenol N-acetylglucosamine transferase [Candidatus Ratteibacteria bacterium]HRV04007.1 UDP-N-acetylglucosamine--N-acetylmuramyl-(pentapeptide) pyrophosphoryl-undecaprenol N-acetylglucosamine transferase [Candidatus Ratteibacteria bacterium]